MQVINLEKVLVVYIAAKINEAKDLLEGQAKK